VIALGADLPAIQRAAVFGLARSGQASAAALSERGVAVVGTDTRTATELSAYVPPAGVELVLGGHPDDVAADADVVVVSPGVPFESPALRAARSRGIPVISEIELAARLISGPVIGITGTNGKSTTTSLCASLLNAAGRPAVACGNIGTPWVAYATSDRSAEAARRPVWVVELSSFQLEAANAFAPDVAVLLNLTPDHLDRHGTLEAYGAAKARIFAHQRPDQTAVLNADDPWVHALEPRARGLEFSRRARPARGAWLEGGAFWSNASGEVVRMAARDALTLRGAHNEENALAAIVATAPFGVGADAVDRAFRSFVPLPHRMTLVRTLHGVAYYNDSKGTNVDATLKSLEGLPDGRVHAILGGKRKNDDFRRLAPLVRAKAKAVLAIGATADEIAGALGEAAPVARVGTLEAAVARAAAEARDGDVVLLSPACASFDQFRNFEHRGEVFEALVRALPESAGARRGAEVR
jgi:UDP-N-acetylmuramoylalanine--D-glutamate ligase